MAAPAATSRSRSGTDTSAVVALVGLTLSASRYLRRRERKEEWQLMRGAVCVHGGWACIRALTQVHAYAGCGRRCVLCAKDAVDVEALDRQDGACDRARHHARRALLVLDRNQRKAHGRLALRVTHSYTRLRITDAYMRVHVCNVRVCTHWRSHE